MKTRKAGKALLSPLVSPLVSFSWPEIGNFDSQAGTSYGYGMAAIVRILVFKSWIRCLYVLRYFHCKVPTVTSDSIGKMKRRGQLWHSWVMQQLSSLSLNHGLLWVCLWWIPTNGPKMKENHEWSARGWHGVLNFETSLVRLSATFCRVWGGSMDVATHGCKTAGHKRDRLLPSPATVGF